MLPGQLACQGRGELLCGCHACMDPCVEQGQPSAGRVQTLKAGGLDRPEARQVACGAGMWLCRLARMPASWGLSGGLGAQDSGPRGLAPLWSHRAAPSGACCQLVERPVVSDSKGGAGLFTRWAQLRGPQGPAGHSGPSLPVSSWAQRHSAVLKVQSLCVVLPCGLKGKPAAVFAGLFPPPRALGPCTRVIRAPIAPEEGLGGTRRLVVEEMG